MLDIFGREVQRGNIIAFSDNNRSGHCNYKSVRLGIVNNILPERVFKKGSNFHTKVQSRVNLYTPLNTPISNIPDEIKLQPVVTFYQFFEHDDANSILFNVKKNGKPKKSINMTTQFLIVDKSTLSESWLKAYEVNRKAFRL